MNSCQGRPPLYWAWTEPATVQVRQEELPQPMRRQLAVPGAELRMLGSELLEESARQRRLPG